MSVGTFERITAADLRQGDIFCFPADEGKKQRYHLVKTIRRDPPGCIGHSHINGDECWDHCAKVTRIHG